MNSLQPSSLMKNCKRWVTLMTHMQCVTYNFSHLEDFLKQQNINKFSPHFRTGDTVHHKCDLLRPPVVNE